MTPEILIVGDPAGRRQLADLIAASGYGVALCSPRELNRRVRGSSPPAAIVVCIAELDADVLLAGLRRTRAGASIPVILYGRLGGNLRDLADVLDIGADHFVEEPATEVELRDALAQFVRPSSAAPGRSGRGWDRDDDHDRGGPPRRDDRFERDEPPRGGRDRDLAPAQGREPSRELDLGRTRDDPRERDPRERDLRERDPRERDPRERDRGSRARSRGRDERRGEALDEPRDDYRREDPRREDPRREDPRREPSREPSREDPRRRSRARGEALGELHRTLERLDASLRSDDPPSDPDLADMGLEGVPDVDPPSGDLDAEPLVTEIGEHIRRPRQREAIRGDDPTLPAQRPVDREPPPERPRPRTSRREGTERFGRPSRPIEPDHDTGPAPGPARRGWRDEPSDEDSAARESSRTRSWERPDDREGPLRRGRERPERPERPESSRSSAVLLGRRPGKDAGRGEPERDEGSGRIDPHARDIPWPEDDFDPSESTMIRRERSSATTRRRSLGGWSGREQREGSADSREFPWGSGRGRDGGASTTRGRPPARSAPSESSRESEPPREAEPSREPSAARAPAVVREAPPRPRTTRRRDADKAPAAALRIDPSLRESGKLGADVDVAVVLWALHEQRFTGKLRLNRARVEKQIWLHDGEAMFARSTATSDRLVDGLLRRGVLTRPQYETARRLAAKEPRRAGQLLVDAGFLKASELDELLRDHLARVIDATFVWSDGSWATEPGERTDEAIQLEVPMAALILDGVRYRCDASELEDRLTRRVGGRGPFMPRLRIGADTLPNEREAAVDAMLDEIGESLRLLPEEESWLRRFDGRLGVAALLAEGADEQALFALLFTLELAGQIDLRGEPEPVAHSDRDPSQVDSERILERLRLAREADYFELLGVGRDASRGEIRQAHTELSSTFADDALEQASRERHARELLELRAAIEEARDILGDDAMRSAYLAHLSD